MMFVELLEDYANQLDLFEKAAFEEISGNEDEAFTKLDDLASTHVDENTPAIDLDEARFVALHTEAFAELD